MRNNGDLSHLGDPVLSTQYLVSNAGESTTYGPKVGFGGLLGPIGNKTLKKEMSSKGSIQGHHSSRQHLLNFNLQLIIESNRDT